MNRLAGKVALITGGNAGIGEAVAELLREQGARVHGFDLPDVDLMKLETLSGHVDAVAQKEGGIDILVNNAGLTRDGLFMRMKDEDWDLVLRVNLDAAFRLARAAIRGMMKKRWGRIVTITSVVGTTGNAGQANYAASKAALVGMSKALAAEVASRNVTVNCVAPGFIATPMTDVLNEKQREAILGTIPAGRLGVPEDIGAAVVYLASQEAGYMTGQTLHVNGGMAMI